MFPCHSSNHKSVRLNKSAIQAQKLQCLMNKLEGEGQLLGSEERFACLFDLLDNCRPYPVTDLHRYLLI